MSVSSLYKSLMRPSDPLTAFRFHVEVSGLLFAGFTEVSGLSVEIETEEYREGGINDHVHTLPKGAKYQNIVLKQGILYSNQLWKWIEQVVRGKVKTRNGRIILMDYRGIEMWHWTFDNAYPVKWSGTDLKSSGNEPFIETLELTHTGIRKVRNLTQILHALF